MEIIYFILMAADILLLGILPFAFLYTSGRFIFRRKIFYLAALAILMLVCFSVTLVFNNVSRMVIIAGVFVCIGQFLFAKGIGALFYQVVYITGLFACQIIHASVIQSMLTDFYAGMPADIYMFGCMSLGMKFIIETAYTLLMIQLVKFWYAKGALPRKQLAGLLAIPVYSIAVIYSMILMGEVFFLRYGLWLLVIHGILLLGVDIYCIYIYYQFSRSHEMEMQMKFLEMQDKMHCDYYTTLDQRLEETRRVMHDIRNHLNVIEQLYADGQAGEGHEYANQLSELLEQTGLRNYSENKLLNLILNDKLKAAMKQGIHVDTQIWHMPLAFMEKTDMTVIFTNLLDNAIRSAGKSEKKQISIRSDAFNDLLVIRIENTFETDDEPEAPDADAGKAYAWQIHRHGLGLRNVRKAVEKYHGSMDIQKENGVFTVILMFPKM